MRLPWKHGADITDKRTFCESGHQNLETQLRNWPVQITLLPIKAPYYDNADLLVAADCCAYAYAGFHNDFIKGRALALGCPKLDDANAYKEKLAAILSDNDIKSVTIAYMEVPCCMGLVRFVEDAVRDSGKNIPIKKTKIGIQGQIISYVTEDYFLIPLFTKEGMGMIFLFSNLPYLSKISTESLILLII